MSEPTQLEKAGQQLRRARATLETSMRNAESWGRIALSDGMSESEVARTLGVDRMTVRKWAGKR